MSRTSGEHTLDVGLLDNPNGVGDVVKATIVNPVLEGLPGRALNVVINVGVAREQDEPHAIRVEHLPAHGRLTAAEAHQLAVDLNVAADTVAGIRTQLGYDT